MIEELEKALEENTTELKVTTSTIRMEELLVARELIMSALLRLYREERNVA